MKRESSEQNPAESLPSKTQIKKQMLDLQKLGEELISLTPRQLDTLPLPDNLMDAVSAAKKMTKRRALYRQRQYIGRLMRDIDDAPIRLALDELRHPERQSAARFHRIEAWRDRLVADPGPETTLFVEEHPGIDRQQLIQKIRAAVSERQKGKPAGAGRALFRFITDYVANLDIDGEEQ